MRLDWRYLPVSLLVGVAVCAVVGAGAGVVRALLAEDTGAGAGAVAGTVVASGLAGLVIGAALGCLLGALSGVAATVAVGRRTDPGVVALRVGLCVAVTYVLVLVVLAGLTGGTGWHLPTPLQWVGVAVPTLLAAGAAARAAREVPTL